MAVYKDKKTGKWYFRVYVNDPISGERKQVSRKGFNLRKDAIDAEAMLTAQYFNREVIIDDIKFSVLVEEFYNLEKDRVKLTTFTGYKYQIDKHILPIFNGYSLKLINRKIVEQWYRYVSNLDYSYTYKNKLLTRLQKIFEFANDRYDYKNRDVKMLPLFKKQPGEQKRTATIYTEEMFTHYISFAKNIYEETLFKTLFYTGMRIGELRGLKWIDFDSNSNTITIERQITSKVKGMGPLVLTPKSESSNRNIHIPKILTEQLLRWKKLRKEFPGYDKSWQIFGDRGYASETSIRRIANRLAADSKLPQIKLHDFRHSYTTMLRNMNVDPIIVTEQAGHSSVQITLDIYTHVTSEEKKGAIADIFDKEKS